MLAAAARVCCGNRELSEQLKSARPDRAYLHAPAFQRSGAGHQRVAEHRHGGVDRGLGHQLGLLAGGDAVADHQSEAAG